MHWKYMRHVFHTAGDPPSIGSTIFANRGSIQKSRNALPRVVRAKSASTKGSKSRHYIPQDGFDLQTLFQTFSPCLLCLSPADLGEEKLPHAHRLQM
jgi:hypothetical protein